jgi:hypothetical protein
MPLFPAIGAALKIGGKALGAIVSKAKAKRAEKKSLKLKEKASDKELELNAMAQKLGLVKPPARLTTGDISNANKKDDYKRFVKGSDSKALDKVLPQSESKSNFNLKIILPIVAVVVLFLLFMKRKR